MGVDRRRLLRAAGAAGVAILGGHAAACTWRGTTQPERDLAILSGRDDTPGGERHRLVREWSDEHSDAPARIIEVGGVADAQRSEMVARAQSRDTTVDIYNLDVTWIAEFAEGGYIRPLATSGLDTSGFLRPPLESCRYAGQLWALPFNTDAGLLHFRSDLVPDAPEMVDWGWVEARTEEILADPPPELEAGYAGQLADYEGFTVNALERIWAAHGTVVEGDWRDPEIDVDSEAVGYALRQLGRAFHQEDRQLILRRAVQFDEAATTRAFREGKVAFMRNWPVAFRSLQTSPDDDSLPVAEHADVRRLPGPSVLGGQCLAVADHARDPAAAQALVEWLASERSQLRLLRDGGLPAVRDEVYDHPDVTSEYPFAATLRESIRTARPRPVTPYYARFSEVFRSGARQAMRNPERRGQLPDGFAADLAEALRGRRR